MGFSFSLLAFRCKQSLILKDCYWKPSAIRNTFARPEFNAGAGVQREAKSEWPLTNTFSSTHSSYAH